MNIPDFLSFLDESPASFQTAAAISEKLRAADFAEIRTTDRFSTVAQGFVKDGGAVIAWRIPETIDELAFRIVGTHTDSPALQVKPQPDREAFGYRQLGMEVYGGLLLNSLLDRELGLAGRLVLIDGREVLVRTGPWLRVPQLAIHLDRSVNDGLGLDRQRHLIPVLGLADSAPANLTEAVAAVAGVAPEQVAALDLFSYPTQPAARFGFSEEFVAAARLDNLASVYPALHAFLADEPTDAVSIFAAFDHEEVGSQTRTGAAGPMLAEVLQRLALTLGVQGDAWHQALARSSCLSADVAHGVHPNYPEKHDPDHTPILGGGPVLKINAGQRYATDAVGAALWHRACQTADVQDQRFVSNNTVPCGSTIGPITATRLGIRTVDVGIPILSMHSAREMCAATDVQQLARVLTAYYHGECR